MPEAHAAPTATPAPDARQANAAAAYRLLAEHTSDLVYRTDRDGLVRWLSPSFRDTLGYRYGDLLGHQMSEFSHPSDVAANAERRRQLYAGEITMADLPTHTVHRVRHNDGHWVWVSATVAPAPDDLDDGFGAGGLIVSMRVVDDLVSARDAAVQARIEADRTRLSLDTAAIGMALTSPNGMFRHVNQALCDILRYPTPAELVGRHFTDVTHPEDRESSVSLARELVDGHRDRFTQRKRYLTAGGDIVWVDLSVAAVRESDGAIHHFVAQMVDVTAEVRNFEALQRSVRQFRVLAENANGVVYQTNQAGIIEWISPSVATELGYDPDLLVGTAGTNLVAPEDLPKVAHTAGELRRPGTPRAAIVRYVNVQGERRWMAMTRKPLIDSAGAVTGAVFGLHDVTAEQQARHRLARSEERFRLAMAGAPHGMAVTDVDGRLVDINAVLCRLLVATRDELLGTRLADQLDPAGCLPVPTLGEPVRQEHALTTPVGERWLDHSVSAVLGEDEGVLYFVHQVVDQTAARDLQRELARRASSDTLTGIPNRLTLMERLAEMVEANARIGLVFCDVDGLKQINDTLGHRAGDELLTTVGQRLQRGLRKGDAVGRVGGDEFVVVLDGIASPAELEHIGENLRTAVIAERRLDDVQAPISVSMGAALALPDETAESLLSRADTALYTAKRTGRNRLVIAT